MIYSVSSSTLKNKKINIKSIYGYDCLFIALTAKIVNNNLHYLRKIEPEQPYQLLTYNCAMFCALSITSFFSQNLILCISNMALRNQPIKEYFQLLSAHPKNFQTQL